MTASTPTTGKKPDLSVETAPSVSNRIVLLIVLVVLGATLGGLFISGGNYTPSPLGLPDAGPIVAWAIPVASALGFVTALACVGWLLFAGFFDPDHSKQTVSRQGRRALVRVSIAATAWAILSFVSAILVLTNVLAVDVGTALSPGIFFAYAGEIEEVRTLLFAAVCALVVAIGSALSVRLANVSIWLALALVAVAAPATAGHAAGLGNHSLAVTSSVAHALTATLWVGGIVGLGTALWTRGATLAIAVRRFAILASTCVVVLALSGLLNAYVRLASPGDLVTSGYGRLVLIKTLLLVAAVGVAAFVRSRVIPTLASSGRVRSFVRIVSIEIAILAAAGGLGIALSESAPTRANVLYPTQGEVLLGRPFPPSPDVANVLFGWNFDLLFFGLSVLAIVYYLLGVRRLRARGDAWPVMQTISWVAGWLIVIWATNAGISNYADVSVGLHMIQHMTLSMMAPIFIVLGAPVTLALRTLHPSPDGGRGPRELLLAGLHSKLAIFFTNPIVILGIYVIGLYGLYMTDLFGSLMRSHVGHIAMTVHFLVSGLLLAYVAIGTDPKPRPLPYWGRMLLVLTAIVLHTFFALALMSATTVIGANWYSLVRPPWLADPVRDSLLGGQIAWGVAEVPTVLMLLIIGVQWARSDERESTRRDRKTQRRDMELDDYNRYLQALNERAERDAENRFKKKG